MKLVSWNIGAAFGPYVQWHDRAWHWLPTIDADLAFLQECVPPDWARERWTIVNLPFTYWASALVAKPALGLRPLELDPSSLLGGFGSYLATGEIPIAEGSPMLVASVHTRAAEAPDWVTAGHDRTALARSSVGVPWSNDVAFAGYRELLAARAPRHARFLIGGDWNTARFVDEDGVPKADGDEFFTRAGEAGWRELTLDSDGREGRSWYGAGGALPYQPDHVFADRETAKQVRSMAIEAYPVESLGLSDHAALVLELDVDAATSAGEEGTDGRRRRAAELSTRART
jgi:endonuclease/exonuclease/phosphatase family metal-dependent hydrolase